MPTVKKRVLDLLEDLRTSIDLEPNSVLTSDEIEDLIQENILVTKEVFDD